MIIPSSVPDEEVCRMTVPPAAAEVIVTPVAAEAVEQSTCKAGLVVPFGPTAKAVALAEVRVTGPVANDVTPATLFEPSTVTPLF